VSFKNDQEVIIVFSKEAELDIANSVIWYESQVRGLGEAFLLNLDRTLSPDHGKSNSLSYSSQSI
jgi:hypothetical protein